MSCILFDRDDENIKKINIDELYEKNQRRDLKQISIFNKLLNRIHTRITHIARNKRNDKHAWFTIPEYIFGEPVYDKGECIAYIVAKLEDNGFYIRYLHPNTLFISWENWVPSYVRTELKKKKGIIVDEKGNILQKLENKEENVNNGLFNDRSNNANNNQDANKKPQKQYTPISTYKPSGNLVYNPEMFEKIEKKVVFES